MLTSKDIIERTGISRATLNNYIASGLLRRPEVLPPGPADGAAPRIGYFPDDSISRVETIQRLKQEGWSIGRIVAHFAAGTGAAPAGAPPTPAAASRAADATSPSPMVAQVGATPGAPRLTPIAVLATTLEEAPDLWVRLTAQDYFELVNELWAELETILRRHGGLPGRHPDEGMMGYFLPAAHRDHRWSALAAAHESRAAVRQLSLRWQARKGWAVEVFMNTGIDAGQDWMGAIGPALRVMGEAAERAETLSRCARGGAILVTRGLLGTLPPDALARVGYGVTRTANGEANSPLRLTFAPLGEIAAPRPVPPRMADLSVAELLDLQSPQAASTAAPMT